MYEEYFGLSEPPFSLAPDPRFLFMSGQHREALAHLLYGVGGRGGFVLLTGEVGTGKTTVCRCLLEQLPEECDTAFIVNPRQTAPELLESICEEFRIACPNVSDGTRGAVDRINRFLLDGHGRGRTAVLIVDEAQNLDDDVLEQLRLLTNLETRERKLLQVILLGQPELRARLDGPGLRQVAQRITARFHLEPLSRGEIGAYVAHRLATAGGAATLFPPSLSGTLYRLTGGVPRLVNVVCDRALLGAFVRRRRRVDRATLRQAAREVFGTPRRGRGLLRAAAAALAVAAGILLALRVIPGKSPAPPAPSGEVTPAAAPPVETPSPPAPVEPDAPGAGAPAAASATPPAIDIMHEVPADGAARSEAAALGRLLGLWGAARPAGEGGDPCAAAADAGLRCLSGQGDLDLLRRLNRPAVLKLFDREGRPFYGVLTGVRGGRATLVTGWQTRIGPLSWYGTFTLLWRPPPRYAGPLLPGSRGPAVAWLAGKIASIAGDDTGTGGSDRYDENLATSIRTFQEREGLEADGFAGPRTIIRLNTLDTAPPRPPLIVAGGEG